MMFLTSCTNGDYTDYIPSNSAAIIAVKPEKMDVEASPFNGIKQSFSDDNEVFKGIDITKEVFLFETPDGVLGMCAAISNEGDFTDLLQSLKNKGITNNFVEDDGFSFCCINKSWVIGYNSIAVIVLGPVLASDRARTVRRIKAYLNQEEETSVKKSPLWEHLQEVEADTKMVAQSNMLPEQIASALALGAPKGTAPEDILIEAEITFSDSTLHLKGRACSYNVNIKQSLQKAQNIYRQLTTDWKQQMTAKALVGIFMNVNGKELTPYLHNNKALNTLLLGTDAYDKIRDNKEEMAILLSPNAQKEGEKQYSAEVKNIPNGTVQNKERLIVLLNIMALGNSKEESILPLLGSTKQIIYTLKD